VAYPRSVLIGGNEAGAPQPQFTLGPVIDCQRTNRELIMAKGQMKGNKEAKKPKADKPKSGASAYKLSQGSGGQTTITPTKKK
jgi:hypothetical protein